MSWSYVLVGCGSANLVPHESHVDDVPIAGNFDSCFECNIGPDTGTEVGSSDGCGSSDAIHPNEMTDDETIHAPGGVFDGACVLHANEVGESLCEGAEAVVCSEVMDVSDSGSIHIHSLVKGFDGSAETCCFCYESGSMVSSVAVGGWGWTIVDSWYAVGNYDI